MQFIFVQPVLQSLALLLTVLSSFYFIKSVLKISPIEVARMSGAHFDYNEDAGRSFAVQKADTVIGFALLLCSALVQMISIAAPVRFIDLDGLSIPQFSAIILLLAFIWVMTAIGHRFLVEKYVGELKQWINHYKKRN